MHRHPSNLRRIVRLEREVRLDRSFTSRFPGARPKSSSALIAEFPSHGPRTFFARPAGIRIRPSDQALRMKYWSPIL